MSEITQEHDLRRVFIEELIALAETDDKIVLITCDVGFNYLEKFKERFPGRFFNFGVTEEATVMIAVGLAVSGFKPYVYSMINFVLFRPYEMVRNGVVGHRANVKLVGVSGSEKYKFLGFSHNMNHPNEDMVACDNMGLLAVAPRNEKEVVDYLRLSYQHQLPSYIRL